MRVRIHLRALGFRTLARYFFLALGISCLGIYSGVFLQRELYQAYESRQFDRAPHADGVGAFAAQGTVARSTRDGGPGRKAPRSSKPLPAAAIIGRLSVQRLHLSVMVREGVDGETLQLAVGHIPATALPGHAGNVAVAGHRDTFFRGLKGLQTKDEIRFSTLDGEFLYVVESLMIVEPENVGVLAVSADNVLTLVTCYPFAFIGNAPKRFVVRAKQVSPPAAPLSVVE
jgi:sortase A